MDRIAAAAKFAEAYKAYQIRMGRTCNIEAATAYSTQDVLSMVRHMSDADAIAVIEDEAAFYQEAA